MKRVTISELESDLGAYLAAVSGGETVVVCDRDKAVARIEPIENDGDRLQVREPTITDPEERARRLAAIKPVVQLTTEQAQKVQEILEDMRADRF